MELLILIAVAVIFMLFTSSRNAKKQQAKREEMFSQQMVPGAWVMTQSGYYGRYVETDGDVIVLENSDGTETLWSSRAIAVVQDPPFAPTEENEQPLDQPEGEQQANAHSDSPAEPVKSEEADPVDQTDTKE